MRNTLTDEVMRHVLKQVRADSKELKSLPYAKWYERVENSVRSFVPELVSFAPDLMREVKLTLNSPRIIRETWASIEVRLPKKLKDQGSLLSSELVRESYLLTEITGETVSALISDFLCSVRPDIAKNNRSTYPDLYFKWCDYTLLPKRTKTNPSGPALKGEKPTSVPDGIEIKSQRGRAIRVNCHHPHQGMHLVVTFDYVKGWWDVYDVFIGYLSREDYRRATRNTTATTEKFSFGQAPFISVIDASVKGAEISADAM